jgi:integrase
MARPRNDGAPTRAARKRVLTELTVQKTNPEASAFNIWDLKAPGLVLRVQPSGVRALKFVYSFHSRPRWYHIGLVPLSDARRIAAKFRLAVAEGKDPVAERKAERGSGTFAELATRYVEFAKKKNKSWQQADYLVRKHLLPRWGKLGAKNITRGDVRQVMESIAAPIVGNQTLAAASAIFSWGIKHEIVSVNPCKLVDRHPTKDRERVLSDAEIQQFWAAFDSAGLMASSALKVLLLLGQRPGEVCRMRLEHIKDGWWEMPGEPVAALGWPGTKNKQTHRVWLAQAVRDIIAELSDDATTGFVFTNSRGKPIDHLDIAMRQVCSMIGVERATPHDLRRTHGSTITRLGFGRDAMNRVQNHKEGGIASVYDRHEYAEENKNVIEKVATFLLGLAEGRHPAGNVIRLNTL